MKKINIKMNKKNIIKIGIFVVALVVFCILLCVIIGEKDTKKNGSVSNEKSKESISGDAQQVDKKEDLDNKMDGANLIKELDKKYEAIEKNSKIKKAYLTFDDGPSKHTKKILDVLDKYDIKATFFVKYNEGMEDTYKEIVNRGNAIALHTYSHSYAGIYKSEKAYFDDLEKISKYVEDITGVKTNIMRFPGGSSNAVSKHYCKGIMKTLTKKVKQKGYKYFDWNASNDDAEGDRQPKFKLINAVKRDISGKKDACLLMHDAQTKETTLEALPSIIDYLKSKGYTMLPITNNTKEFHHANLNN